MHRAHGSRNPLEGRLPQVTNRLLACLQARGVQAAADGFCHGEPPRAGVRVPAVPQKHPCRVGRRQLTAPALPPSYGPLLVAECTEKFRTTCKNDGSLHAERPGPAAGSAEAAQARGRAAQPASARRQRLRGACAGKYCPTNGELVQGGVSLPGWTPPAWRLAGGQA